MFGINIEGNFEGFDEDFKKIETLKWLPWVGKDYSNSKVIPGKKLLIVGESHYKWHETDEEEQEGVIEMLDNILFTRDFINHEGLRNENYVNPPSSRLIKNLEKSILWDEAPSIEDKLNLWYSSSYFNILQHYLESREDRSIMDFSTGWDTFFKVIDILKPDYCVFCGVESSRYAFDFNQAINKYGYKTEGIQQCPETIGNTYPRFATIENSNGYEIKLIFIKHPSSYFPWYEWAKFIHQQLK